MRHPTRMQVNHSALLVIDVQERLMTKIPGAANLVHNIAFLIDAARLLEVETAATEQYPRGLGPTVAALAERIPVRPDKVAFSSCAAEGLLEGWRARGVRQMVLTGIETHVCVLNTTLDLLAENFQVYLAVDGLASRYTIDHDTALRRLERAGAILTTTETCAFEWLEGAYHPRFKEISALVQQRMKALT